MYSDSKKRCEMQIKKKEIRINKVGRVWAYGFDIEYRNKNVKIELNEYFTREYALENLNNIIDIDSRVEFKNKYQGKIEIELYPVNYYIVETDQEKEKKKKENKEIVKQAYNKAIFLRKQLPAIKLPSCYDFKNNSLNKLFKEYQNQLQIIADRSIEKYNELLNELHYIENNLIEEEKKYEQQKINY